MSRKYPDHAWFIPCVFDVFWCQNGSATAGRDVFKTRGEAEKACYDCRLHNNMQCPFHKPSVQRRPWKLEGVVRQDMKPVAKEKRRRVTRKRLKAKLAMNLLKTRSSL